LGKDIPGGRKAHLGGVENILNGGGDLINIKPNAHMTGETYQQKGHGGARGATPKIIMTLNFTGGERARDECEKKTVPT